MLGDIRLIADPMLQITGGRSRIIALCTLLIQTNKFLQCNCIKVLAYTINHFVQTSYFNNLGTGSVIINQP